jgi:3-dehydrosphinganine reductase
MNGKTALVTGGSSGLGFVLAEQLGKAGYRVIVVARNKTKIEEARQTLEKSGIEAIGVSCDVVDEIGLDQLVDLVKSRYGKIDFLVLNAGMVSPGAFADFKDTHALKQDIEVDLWGTILSAYKLLPLLQRGSKILMISSGFGLMGAAGYTMYCAAKAGMINFAESLRRELLNKGINVYVACPGDMDTPQFYEEIRTSPDWMKAGSPRKLMKAEVVAAKILKQCKGSMKFLIIPSADVKLLVLVGKLVPRKFRDFLLDKMFPKPN